MARATRPSSRKFDRRAAGRTRGSHHSRRGSRCVRTRPLLRSRGRRRLVVAWRLRQRKQLLNHRALRQVRTAGLARRFWHAEHCRTPRRAAVATAVLQPQLVAHRRRRIGVRPPRGATVAGRAPDERRRRSPTVADHRHRAICLQDQGVRPASGRPRRAAAAAVPQWRARRWAARGALPRRRHAALHPEEEAAVRRDEMLALVQQLALQQLGAPARASSGGRRGRALALRRRRRRRRLLLPVRLLRPLRLLLASMEQLPQPEHRQPERQQGRPARRRAHHATRGRLLGAAIPR
jgi:hypothetical protein